MFDSLGGTVQQVRLMLYTDSFVIRGSLTTRQRRVTDMLNLAEDRFLVLSDVTTDEFGPHGSQLRAEFAQVNLASVLFAVVNEPVTPAPELRTPKIAEEALISIPPFKVTGHIHLMPERSLREALSELTGHFLPVTGATFWSEALDESRTEAELLAVNHERAQILAPHRVNDPWAGLEPGAGPSEDRPPDATGW
jgi:hypothetical protein